VSYEVTLGEASATVDNVHDVLAVAAELVAHARSRLTITCDGDLDEARPSSRVKGFARCARVRAQPHVGSEGNGARPVRAARLRQV
jgi:hypothetical protein